MARINHAEGLPENQTDLEERIKDWFDPTNTGEYPKDVSDHVGPFFHMIMDEWSSAPRKEMRAKKKRKTKKT